MSGHSKWSKVKHQKATTDAVKSASFTRASRGITVAVKEGGGIADPDKNFRLRLAIEFARSVNMPKDNIERAIERAKGSESGMLDTVVYEGYGPGGVAVLVMAATDNHQRTSANVKHQFDRSGGSIASPGAVGYLFQKRGILLLEKSGTSFDAVLDAAITGGADDVVEKDDVFEVYTKAADLFAIKTALAPTFAITHAALIMHPNLLVSVSDEIRVKIEELVEILESDEDVLEVYTNME